MRKITRRSKNKSKGKVRGEAYELISTMAILCVQAMEHRFTRFYRCHGAIAEVYKGKEFLDFTKKCFAHDKDLKVLADNFEVFLRVVERVATRK